MALQVVKPQEDKGTLYHVSTRKGSVGKAVRCRSNAGEDCGRMHIRTRSQKLAQAFADRVVQAQNYNDNKGLETHVVVPFDQYAYRIGTDKAVNQLKKGPLIIFDYTPQNVGQVTEKYEDYAETTFEGAVYHKDHKHAGEPLDAVGTNGKPKFNKALFNDSHFFADKDVYMSASVTKTNMFSLVETATAMLLREDYDPEPSFVEHTIRQRREMVRNLQREFSNMKQASADYAQQASDLSVEAKELTARAKEHDDRDVKKSLNAEVKNVREEAAVIRKLKTVVDAVADEQKRRRDNYRDITARLVERQRNLDPVAANVPKWHVNSDFIGDAELNKNAPAFGSPDWIEQRQTIMGGTDVAGLARNAFENRSANFVGDSKVKAIELQPKNDEQAINPVNTSYEGEERTYNNFGAGGAYRGNAWEPRLVKEFADDYKGRFEVYEAKGQYKSNNPEKPFQVFNIDGVLLDCETEENGILESKNITVDSDDGGSKVRNIGHIDNMDQGFRAQVLYYLNATGLKFAVVRIQENDYSITDYYLRHDDPVHKSTEMMMPEFITNYVAPYWKETQEKRNAGWYSFTSQFAPED